jgi:hypothetical protein
MIVKGAALMAAPFTINPNCQIYAFLIFIGEMKGIYWAKNPQRKKTICM